MGIKLCAEVTRGSLMSLSMDSTHEDMNNETEPDVFSDLTLENDTSVCHKRCDTDSKETFDEVKAARETRRSPRNRSCPRVNHHQVQCLSVSPKPRQRHKNQGRLKSESLAEKLAKRKENPDAYDDFVEGERQAEVYMNAIQDSSMKHLAEAYTTVESILITEEEIEDEIDRQEEVIKQANSDAREAEKDIDDTSHMLKNIKSLGGKFSNLIHGHHGHKSANAYVSDEELEINLQRSLSHPAMLPSYSSNQSKQEWINKGVDQLCSALDVVESRSKAIGNKLENTEEAMNILDQNIENIDNKIGHQTNLMKTIIRE